MFGRSIALACLAGVTLLSLSVRAAAAGDPEKGELKFYTCYGCHGLPNYRNAYPDYSVPMLRHQTAEYIVSALKEYRGGERPHPTMHAQAASLSDQDIADIAAYLQSSGTKPTKTVSGKTPEQVATCVSCHGDNGTGLEVPMDPRPPVLAGQHEDYLEQALIQYRNGRRKNPVMNGMAKALKSEDDVKIAAHYFAEQESPLTTASTNSK
jgi:cytochrome c553